MSEMTKEQRERVDAAKNAIQRRIQQIVSSGESDIPACIVALKEISDTWK